MAEAAHLQSDGDLRGHVSNNFTRWFAPALPWAGLTFALVAAAGWPKKPPLIADSIAYRALALGRFNEVLGSISGRVLHPATVRVVSFALGINIDQAFFVVALVSLALLIGTVAWILRQVTGFGALSLFGIGPAALWSLLRQYGHDVLAKSPQWLKLAGISGLLYFFIAPAVSDWLERDIGYAWPLFWLATPALFKMLCPWAGGTAITLLLENLAACWIPYMLVNSPSHPELFSVGGLCVALAMQAAALWTLRQADVGQAQFDEEALVFNCRIRSHLAFRILPDRDPPAS